MEDVSTLFNTFSDLSDIDKSISVSEFKTSIISNVEPILSSIFANCTPKQKARPYHDRVAIACPICGDSTKNFHAKRGNFILAGKHIGYYKCHNCGAFMRIDNFFKEFNIALKLDVINYLSNVVNNYEHNQNIKYDMSYLLDMESIEKFAIDREEFKTRFGYKEVTECAIVSWLNKRLQFNYKKYLMDVKDNKLIILNLTRGGGILGIQKRLFAGPNKFETFKLKKLYTLMEKVIDETDNWDYLDTLSSLFNICLIDFNKPVIIFEGPMDSFLYNNSIANTGANKTMPIDIPVKYWYDYDKTGIKKSIEYIEKGQSVFLWSKLIKEYELPNRLKWDLNDLVIYMKEHNLKISSFNKYFSNDPLDILDI